MKVKTNVVIIGAGYYGCYATWKLSELYPNLNFLLIEKESEICTRASSTNQGQFHRGYMYTAKPSLVYECSKYAKAFESEFPTSINKTKSYYGIHKDSQVSQAEFEQTCTDADLYLEQIHSTKMFSQEIVAVYKTDEATINTAEMRKTLALSLFQRNVEVLRSTAVEDMDKMGQSFVLQCSNNTVVEADIVINATFAGVNQIHSKTGITPIPTKNDVFMHFMIELPDKYRGIATTVAVGDFCSLMPSQFRGTHLLAVGGVRNIASSLDMPPSEDVATNNLARQLFDTSIEKCSEWVPFLTEGVLRGYTVGTRTEYRNSTLGYSLSEVKVIADHDNIENYVVLLGGKISCLAECLRPLTNIVNKFEGRVNQPVALSLL